MSANNRSREVAKRLFAAELREADHMFKEDDDEYAPSYMLLPSGGKANRVLVVGTLTEKEERDGYFSCRINDSTGNFLVYAGQYQPEAADALRNIDAPAYVAVVGKPKTFESDEGDVISNVRPETVVEVSEGVRNKWVSETAEDTLERLNLSPENDEYVERSEDHYGSERADIVDDVISALENLDMETQ